MDISKLQSDSNNDVNSLEGTGTTVEGDKDSEIKKTSVSSITDTTVGKTNQGSAKPPLFKRMWQRFNVYLLLFILVIVAAIVTSVVLFIMNHKSSESAKDIINSQELSEETLKQLSNSSVTVGNSKQILNIESNAIFSGSVLIRSDLEVAGDVKIGGELQLPGITVSGASRFSDLQANSLAIASSATVQGPLTAKNGITVTGTSIFNGALSASQITTSSLQLSGDLVLTNHIVAGGAVPGSSKGNALGSGGTASVSGSDTTGSVTINTGSGPGAGCFVTMSFTKKFSGTPHVVVTPIGSGSAGISYYVNRSTSEFSICTTNAAPAGQTFGFDYIVLG